MASAGGAPLTVTLGSLIREVMKNLILVLSFTLLGCPANHKKDYSQSINNSIGISRDECIKESRSNDPKHPGKQCSIELVDLVKMFLITENDGGQHQDWSIGAEINTPINWESIGRSGCKDTSLRQDKPDRCGEVFVTIDGEITHTVLEKTTQPGVWTIWLFGSNVGVSQVELFAYSSFGEITDILKNDNISFYLIKRNKLGINETEILYEIKVIGKQKAWLKTEESCGVSGRVCSYTVTIFYDIDSATNAT